MSAKRIAPNTPIPIPSRAVTLAMISGAFLTMTFPPLNLSFLSWLALVPLYKSLENRTLSQGFKLGLIAGTVHYLTLIYWIISVLGHYGGLNIFLSTVPYVLLCLYLALYMGFFALMTTRAMRSGSFMLLTACFWVSLEYARARFLTGFPWCLLGYTQYQQLNLIQIADILGVYGVSFLIVSVNALCYRIFFRNSRLAGKKRKKTALILESLSIVLLAGLTLVYGHYCLRTNQPADKLQKTIRTAVIQGNVDQSVKWDPSYQSKTLDIYNRLTQSVYDYKPELVVWPETAVPFFFQDNDELSPRVMSVAEECGCNLVFGSPAYKQKDKITSYYNRAYLIAARRMQYYDKVHLVPFGEYVPLKRYLSFINRMVPAAGDFESGDHIAPLTHGDLSIGVLICFEAIFPEVARAYTTGGADLLVNLTNDAWFGRTGAPYQHLSMAVFRAVENKLPLIRAANTGFSAFITPQGSIKAQSHLFREQTLKATVALSNSGPTFYARHGDCFALTLAAITLIASLYYIKRRNIKRRL